MPGVLFWRGTVYSILPKSFFPPQQHRKVGRRKKVKFGCEKWIEEKEKMFGGLLVFFVCGVRVLASFHHVKIQRQNPPPNFQPSLPLFACFVVDSSSVRSEFLWSLFAQNGPCFSSLRIFFGCKLANPKSKRG